jgi:hypothetical protein
MCKTISFVSCPLCDQRDAESCHLCHGTQTVSIDRVSDLAEQSLAWAEKLREPAPSWIWESGEYVFEFTAFVVADDRSVTAFDPNTDIRHKGFLSHAWDACQSLWMAFAVVAVKLTLRGGF